MLTIENINKLVDRKLIGGWVVKGINHHPTQNLYIFDIHCFSHIGITIDRCTISLNRIGQLQRNMFKPDTTAYFFNYNGEQTDVCVTKDWIKNTENFLSQLKYIIKEYHNKR
jgi:hypothetical protein